MSISTTKTAVFLGPAYPYRGGIASFTERLAFEFQNQGWKVKILTFTFQYPQVLFPGKNQYSEDNPNYELDVSRSVHSVRSSTWRKTAKLIKELSADLVIAPHWNPFISYSLSAILKRVTCKKLILVHNLFPHESGFFDTNLVNRLMKLDAHYLAISESVYAELENKYPKAQASQYPHPYYDHYGESINKSEAAQLLDLHSDRDYLLFFGLVRSYKGLSQLLTAFAQIALQYPNLDLIVAGEFYESVDIYHRIIANDKLEHRVIVRDQFVPDRLVAAYFSISDLVMLPYISATQSGVGQIATHFDKPILVTNVGSLAQMANHGKTGIVVNNNGDSIAHGISKFYEENLGETLTHNIRGLKNDISWSGLYDHICKVVNLNV